MPKPPNIGAVGAAGAIGAAAELATGGSKVKAAWEGIKWAAIEKSGATALGVIATAAWGVNAAIKGVLKQAGSMEDAMNRIKKIQFLETQFAPLLKGATMAKKRIQELVEFAATTPFQLEGLAEANRTLEIFTKGALSSIEKFRMIGDAAAYAGKGTEEVAFWVGRLYDSLQSGAPIGEAMMRLQEMGLVTGKTRRELESLQKSGASFTATWSTVEKELKKGEGSMQILSQTIGGLETTLADTKGLLQDALGKPFEEQKIKNMQTTLKLMQAMEPAIAEVALQTSVLKNWWDQKVNSFKEGLAVFIQTNAETIGLAKNFAFFSAVLLTFGTVAKVVAAHLGLTAMSLQFMKVAAIGAAKAVRWLGMEMIKLMVNPFVLAAAAIAGVITVMLGFQAHQKKMAQSIDDTKNATAEANAEFERMIDNIRNFQDKAAVTVKAVTRLAAAQTALAAAMAKGRGNFETQEDREELLKPLREEVRAAEDALKAARSSEAGEGEAVADKKFAAEKRSLDIKDKEEQLKLERMGTAERGENRKRLAKKSLDDMKKLEDLELASVRESNQIQKDELTGTEAAEFAAGAFKTVQKTSPAFAKAFDDAMAETAGDQTITSAERRKRAVKAGTEALDKEEKRLKSSSTFIDASGATTSTRVGSKEQIIGVEKAKEALKSYETNTKKAADVEAQADHARRNSIDVFTKMEARKKYIEDSNFDQAKKTKMIEEADLTIAREKDRRARVRSKYTGAQEAFATGEQETKEGAFKRIDLESQERISKSRLTGYDAEQEALAEQKRVLEERLKVTGLTTEEESKINQLMGENTKQAELSAQAKAKELSVQQMLVNAASAQVALNTAIASGDADAIAAAQKRAEATQEAARYQQDLLAFTEQFGAEEGARLAKQAADAREQERKAKVEAFVTGKEREFGRREELLGKTGSERQAIKDRQSYEDLAAEYATQTGGDAEQAKALALRESGIRFQEEAEAARPNVVADSLARIGGGGRAYGGTDPMVKAAERQRKLLEQIASNTAPVGTNKSKVDLKQ